MCGLSVIGSLVCTEFRAIQLVNKLPKDVVPPATFSYSDLKAGQEFCEKMSTMVTGREAE